MEKPDNNLITWDPKTYCLTAWYVPNWPQPIRFSGWGFETTDGFGFFAQEYLGGRGYHIEKSRLEPVGKNRWGSSWWIKLPKARLHFRSLDELIAPNCILRHLSVQNDGHTISWLFDAVLRMVIPWEIGLVAEFEGRELVHSNSNFYHDTEEPEVALRWPDGHRLVVRWLKPAAVPIAFTPYLYVRDQPSMPRYHAHAHCATPAWVIHARPLVDYPAALVFRIWRNPLVLWSRGLLGRYLLERGSIMYPYMKNFWRAGEWHPGKRWHLFGLWPLLPGESLDFAIRIEAI